MTQSSDQKNQISEAVRLLTQPRLGVLDQNFLCQSVGVLNLAPAITIQETQSLEDALRLLRDNRIGCLVVTNKNNVITGIFSERDCVLKVLEWSREEFSKPVSEYMTKDPIAQAPDSTIGFALQLMSQGGFRHLPIIDEQNHPIGLLSVKDVVDYMVEKFTDDLLNFHTESIV